MDLVALAELLRRAATTRVTTIALPRTRRMLIFPPVRSLPALALVLAACSGGSRSNPPAERTVAAAPRPRGSDALLLRVPRSGGIARVTSYPDIDSVMSTASEETPAIDRVLALDRDAGTIAAIDARGDPIWIDLRLGSVSIGTRKPVRGLASIDGSSIYGIGADGNVARFTPSGNWVFEPPAPPRAVCPQPNGMLLVLGGRGAGARVWRIRPPSAKILDSVAAPDAARGTGAPLGDRLYLETSARTLIGIRPRPLATTRTLSFRHAIGSIATTPSGDRFYVLEDSSNELSVVDAYRDRVATRIELPGRARDLRVDPFGRFVLVRAASDDSVWVVAVGTDRVSGGVRSRWRGDVPFVAPDGAIALSQGSDLVFVDGTTLREVQRVDGGASDFWYPFVWDGFRATAVALDTAPPAAADTDTVSQAVVALPDTGAARTRLASPADSTAAGFTVSFASLLDEERARTVASVISVNGQSARVVTSIVGGGITVYRVVMGPYRTRDEADRVGRASGQAYLIRPGPP